MVWTSATWRESHVAVRHPRGFLAEHRVPRGLKNLPGGLLAKFDGGQFQIDWIDNMSESRRLQFTNGTNSIIGTLRLAAGAMVDTAVSIDSRRISRR